MTTPPENLIVQSPPSAEPPTSSPGSRSSHKSPTPDMNLSFETPPRQQPISSDPPPLTAGRRFLPFSSSDEEEDEPGPNRATATSTPPPLDQQPRRNVYSELQYLEATGTVRSSHESKHRGTRTTHHIPRESHPSPTADGSPSSPTPSSPGSSASDPTDKRTKLKLSYRIHLSTEEPQFALIIYEDQTPRSSKVRRNLFCDEQQPQDETESPDASAEPSSPISLQPLPDTPPPPVPSPPPPAEVTPPHTPLEPPGTPHRQRRFPPPGMRTSPRRSRAIMNFTIASEDDSPTGASGSSSNNNNNNPTLQTWPRKNHPTGGSPGGPAAKNRKLATSSTTVRKPLRF